MDVLHLSPLLSDRHYVSNVSSWLAQALFPIIRTNIPHPNLPNPHLTRMMRELFHLTSA